MRQKAFRAEAPREGVHQTSSVCSIVIFLYVQKLPLFVNHSRTTGFSMASFWMFDHFTQTSLSWMFAGHHVLCLFSLVEKGQHWLCIIHPLILAVLMFVSGIHSQPCLCHDILSQWRYGEHWIPKRVFWMVKCHRIRDLSTLSHSVTSSLHDVCVNNCSPIKRWQDRTASMEDSVWYSVQWMYCYMVSAWIYIFIC